MCKCLWTCTGGKISCRWDLPEWSGNMLNDFEICLSLGVDMWLMNLMDIEYSWPLDIEQYILNLVYPHTWVVFARVLLIDRASLGVIILDLDPNKWGGFAESISWDLRLCFFRWKRTLWTRDKHHISYTTRTVGSFEWRIRTHSHQCFCWLVEQWQPTYLGSTCWWVRNLM